MIKTLIEKRSLTLLREGRQFCVIILAIITGLVISILTKDTQQPILSLNDYFSSSFIEQGVRWNKMKVGYDGEANTRQFLQ